MKRRFTQAHGSTLLAATFTIAVGALLIGTLYRTLMPRFRSVHQSSSWHDALQGAEGGANHALYLLNQFTHSATQADNYNWTGTGWTFVDSTYASNGERTLPAASLPVIGGKNNVAVTHVSVDVYTRSPSFRNPPWFRIRSTARADLPGRFTSADKRDGVLRRMNLAATKDGAADPYVARTVEVIAKPQFRFDKAIVTVEGLELGGSSGWTVDSFDSTDVAKSDVGTIAGGIYPSDVAERQSNGDIASMNTAPESTPYTALIDASGAIVAGSVWTNGGDNPDTAVHENVSDSSGVDQDQIYDTFHRGFDPVTKPVWTSISPTPASKTGFVTGTQSSPTRYVVGGGISGFAVTAPPLGTTGYVEIIINGNMNLGGGSKSIVIPPNVYATVYVDGNIDLSNGMTNSDAASSKVASHLTVYGVSTAANATYVATGNAVQILSFYGPAYEITLNGTVSSVGAVVGKSFEISGGGIGGFHYDESLGRGGDIVGWGMTSYFDDSRADL